MAQIYYVGVGHDIANALLQVVNPVPRGDGIIPVDRKYSLTGKIWDDQKFTVLHWDFFNDETEYYNLLGQFGVTTESSSPITLKVRDERFQENDFKYNAMSQLLVPNEDIRQDAFFLRGATMTITHLVEIDNT